MPHLSHRLRRRVEEDFGADAEAVSELVAGASGSERVQAAIVLAAEGDVGRVRSGVALAGVDERDVLVGGGLADPDWRNRLDIELGTGQPPAGRTHTGRPLIRGAAGRRIGTAALVVVAVFFVVVLLPGLILAQYVDEAARTSTVEGRITDTDFVVTKGNGHRCEFAYDVSGTSYQQWGGCNEELAVGDPVEISYRSDDPTSAHIGQRNVVVPLVIGLGAWLVCVVVVVRELRKHFRR